jgi:hypothetical protein
MVKVPFSLALTSGMPSTWTALVELHPVGCTAAASGAVTDGSAYAGTATEKLEINEGERKTCVERTKHDHSFRES